MSSPGEDETSQSQDGIPEVSSARSRLSGALSTAERIVDKYAGDDFPVSPFKRFQSLDSPFPSPTKSPRGIRRRRKKPLPLNTAFHHTFVMKLFDRSVDLAQFPDHTPLYPVCRAWMKNDPHNTNMAPRLRTPTPEPGENEQNGEDKEENEDGKDQEKDEESADDKAKDDKDPDVYKLPPPEPLKVENGVEKSVRVPEVEDKVLPNDFLLKTKTDPDPPETEELLRNHMSKWQEVRKCWKQAAAANERRYADSMQILTTMYEK